MLVKGNSRTPAGAAGAAASDTTGMLAADAVVDEGAMSRETTTSFSTGVAVQEVIAVSVAGGAESELLGSAVEVKAASAVGDGSHGMADAC